MEVVRFPSRGGFSVRSIFVFVLTVIITAILWATFSVGTTHALASNATWTDGGVILYDNHGYNVASNVRDTSGTIPEGATIYKSAPQPGTGSSSSKMLIIYFSPGVDPPKATSAQYAEFSFSGDTISNPQNSLGITVTPQGSDASLGGEVNSSCSVQGIGWIICPVSVFLAESMDNLFHLLADFIKSQPLVLGDENNAMYVVWNIARTIANLAFVIVFLIIIFSQVTNIGVSNYGLKRLIPRLVIAAILVNLSFYIAALALDISNILGYSIQNIFNNVREQVFQLNNDNFSGINNNAWATVTTVVLSGGGLIGGIYFLSDAGPFFLVTLLVGLGLIALFVLLILAARQAIIVLLVVVSPLAFVAYLLPNTEKWFEKWKDLFFTMLIFFPAFSLVFGGSQLAGQIIIQNAGDNIITVIFGMAVQIAPLVITPIILKFSGGLLGRIAQIVNNPKKGILDRTKNWQKESEDLHRNKTLDKDRKWYRPGTAMVQGVNNRKRRRKELTDLYALRADNKWKSGKTHEKIHERAFEAELNKQTIENNSKAHTQAKVNTVNHRLNISNAQMEASKKALALTVETTNANVKEFSAGRMPMDAAGNNIASPELAGAIRRMQTSQQATSTEALRSSNADAQIQREFAQALKKSAALRQQAGGIKHLGADSVLSSAVSAVRRADAEDIKNIQEASDLKPGDLPGAAREMVAAIQSGNSIRARAFQNMLVTAGGAGIDEFRKTIIGLKTNIPADVAEDMRDNLLTNHGGIKAKANDIIDWAAKGGIMQTHTYNAKSWSGLSDKDFIGQHPKTQAYALASNAFTRERAQEILVADAIEGHVLTEDIKNKLRAIS